MILRSPRIPSFIDNGRTRHATCIFTVDDFTSVRVRCVCVCVCKVCVCTVCVCVSVCGSMNEVGYYNTYVPSRKNVRRRLRRRRHRRDKDRIVYS